MRYNVLTSSAYCRAVGLQYFLRVATHRANVLAAALWADPIASSNVTGYGIAARRCRISVILRLLPLGGHSCRKAASAVGLSIHNMASFSIFKQFISPSSFHLLIFIIRDSQAPASVFAKIFENKKTQVILVVVASPIRGNLCSLVRCSNCCVLGALFRFPSFVLICRNFPYSALTRHFLGAT